MEPTQLLDRLEVFKYRHFLILKTADCSHVRTRIRTKIGKSNFGEFMLIRQIHQGFPPPMFPSIRYMVFMNLSANIFFNCFTMLLHKWPSQMVYVYFNFLNT